MSMTVTNALGISHAQILEKKMMRFRRQCMTKTNFKTTVVIICVTLIYAAICTYGYVNISPDVPIGLPISFLMFGVMVGITSAFVYINYRTKGVLS